MALFIASLNSGSNGNCYYIGNHQEAVLIDTGITLRETEKRMTRLGLDMQRVRAIFISHEHSDHITGLAAISRKYQLPVYITAATLSNSRMPVEKHLINAFSAKEDVQIGELRIRAFVKVHDAIDPHSFVVSQQDLRVGVFTDLGHCCAALVHRFSTCHAAFLESNYCETMLANGKYPYFLKQRISGGQGHLSNREALGLFVTYRSHYLSHLILSHLSSNNNRPELVEQLFSEQAGQTRIVVASRYQETAVFCIDGPVAIDEVKLPEATLREATLPDQVALHDRLLQREAASHRRSAFNNITAKKAKVNPQLSLF